MTKVRLQVFDLLDGFGAGPEQSLKIRSASAGGNYTSGCSVRVCSGQ